MSKADGPKALESNPTAGANDLESKARRHISADSSTGTTISVEESLSMGATANDPETDKPNPSSLMFSRPVTFLLLTAITCIDIIINLDLTVISTAATAIARDFNGGSNFSWVATAYLLTFTAGMPLAGKLADVFGRRPSMLGSLIIFFIGSALCGAANSMDMLIVARAVQGLGGGTMLNVMLIVENDIISQRMRVVHADSATAAGIRMFPFMITLVVVSTLAGLLTSKTGRPIFLVQVSVSCKDAATAVATTTFFRFAAGNAGVSLMSAVLMNLWSADSPSVASLDGEISLITVSTDEATQNAFLKAARVPWWSLAAGLVVAGFVSLGLEHRHLNEAVVLDLNESLDSD
ncbi:hypothetical protein HDV05_007912 [Chytridiales sp. JEL 0842]|nr:hypothetical protein HDV05_007912 [Chytridiales sp. JEL 0842]